MCKTSPCTLLSIQDFYHPRVLCLILGFPLYTLFFFLPSFETARASIIYPKIPGTCPDQWRLLLPLDKFDSWCIKRYIPFFFSLPIRNRLTYTLCCILELFLIHKLALIAKTFFFYYLFLFGKDWKYRVLISNVYIFIQLVSVPMSFLFGFSLDGWF